MSSLKSIKQLLHWMMLFHVVIILSSHAVIEYHIIDTSRFELYRYDINHPYRELMMHVWIPQDNTSQQQYPLILFSHGLGDNFNGLMYQQLCTYCASQGYIIASVSHPHGCKPIQFSDGRRAEYLFPAAFHYQPGKHMFDVEADVWLSDMLCALDECEHQNSLPESVLYQKIDTSAIGAMGHSLGGSIAIQLCRSDDRIKAVVNLDGPLYGTGAHYLIKKPLMLIMGSPALSYPTVPIPCHKELMWRWYFNQVWLPQLDAFVSSLQTDVYTITINKIVHGTFSDEALYPDEMLLPWIMDGSTAHEIIHAYVGAFFDTYLKNNNADLLTRNNSPWPEVTVIKK
jgi:pimeloyl-ACP methyl ester carboxylesterase